MSSKKMPEIKKPHKHIIRVASPQSAFPIVNDITERKRTEEALRASNERYRSLYENSTIGIYRTSPDGYILMANPALVSMLGYESFEGLSKRNLAVEGYEPEYPRLEFQKHIERDGEIRGLEAAWKRKDGSIIYVRESARLVRDEKDQPLYYEGMVEDVTERKRAEDALHESEQRLASIYDTVGDVIFYLAVEPGEQYRFASVNPAFCRVTGFPSEQVIGRKVNEIIPEPSLSMVLGKYRQAIEEKAIVRWEETSEYPTGRLIGEVSIAPIFDNAGNCTNLVGSVHDITERKRGEEALRESEEKFRTLADQSPNMIFINKKGRIVYANTKCEELTGYRLEEFYAPDFDFIKLIAPESLEMIRQYFNGHQKGNEFQPYEYTLITKDGKRIEAINSSKLILYESEDAILGVVTDISDRKHVEEEIRQLNTGLEQRVEERTRELRDAQEKLIRQEKLAVLGQLAGGVGHELRNPLGVINSAVYYLKLVQPDANEKIKQYHAMIEQETHTAEKIINDLLDFARIKSVDRELVSVPGLIQRVLDRYPVPEAIVAKVKFPAGLPEVFADPRQMEQVLGNLVVNACQAMASQSSAIGVGEGGRLTISASQQKEMVAIAVKDTGVGIPPENMSKLFEPLFTTKLKGIGLGLAVSKKLAEANSGRIEVKSEPGKGSTFTLYLPVKQ